MMAPTSPTAAPTDKNALIAAYEELRRQFLNRQLGPGLTLFMHRGMREWMNAYSLWVAPPPVSAPITPDNTAVLPQGVRTEIVLILAGMLLHGCQEARP
jgi:hypothetical protein